MVICTWLINEDDNPMLAKNMSLNKATETAIECFIFTMEYRKPLFGKNDKLE